MSIISLKKIGTKVLKLEHGNEAQSSFDNPISLLPNTNVYANIEENRSNGTKERGNESLSDRNTHDGWTDTQSSEGIT